MQDTVWLNQKQMAEFLGRDTNTIGLHLGKIFRDEEVEEWSTTEDFSGVHQEGHRKVIRIIKFYNFEAILSVGYRVNSKKGVYFRQWPPNERYQETGKKDRHMEQEVHRRQQQIQVERAQQQEQQKIQDRDQQRRAVVSGCKRISTTVIEVN